MDAIDRKIVVLLQEDASLSLAQIAHRVGLSQSPCWKRIQRLEKAGIILRRVALISPESIGMGLTVFVSIETGDHSSAWIAKFAQLVTAIRAAVAGDAVLSPAVARRVVQRLSPPRRTQTAGPPGRAAREDDQCGDQ